MRRHIDTVSKGFAAGLVALLAGHFLAAATSEPALAAEAKARKGEAKKHEVLACKTGTEDRHARIAVEVIGGHVGSIAYYSIWKPRTCSVHLIRGDAYSKWHDVGSATTATLGEEKGTVLIHNEKPGQYQIFFREVDRMRYCGAEGKINGSLIVTRGKSSCELEGVMDDDPSKPRSVEAAETATPNEAVQANRNPEPTKGSAPAN